MIDKLRVGLFGVALESNNYGVSALAITQIRLLQQLEKINNIAIEYIIFSDDKEISLERLSRYIKTDNIVLKYVVRLKTGLKGLLMLKKDIKMCDLIIDLTYGDSFSDIYGKKNYYVYTIPKLVAIWCRKRLVLGPQTIGPYYNQLIKKISVYIMKKADCIFTRDIESKSYVEKFVGHKNVFLTSDLAMELPYHSDKYSLIKKDNAFNIGLNVSLLLWKTRKSDFNIKIRLSYKNFIEKLLGELKKNGYTVHLITHVFDSSDETEYELAKLLSRKFDNTILAPKFNNPIEAKSYMCKLDLFIGSRMHATIGAFSSGVPVIPISYSRKFEGLYNSIGYDHCINCANEDEESAINKVMEKIKNYKQLSEDRRKAYKVAIEQNKSYKEQLQKLVKA